MRLIVWSSGRNHHTATIDPHMRVIRFFDREPILPTKQKMGLTRNVPTLRRNLRSLGNRIDLSEYPGAFPVRPGSDLFNVLANRGEDSHLSRRANINAQCAPHRTGQFRCDSALSPTYLDLLGMASFYLRAVCQNRNLWGVEDFEEITIRHSKYAASRFAHEAAPALMNFANSSPMPFVNGVRAARERIVARTDEDRTDFLRRRGFSKAETGKIIETVLAEEGRPPESIFDFVQGITAVARDKPHQDARLDMEAKAKKLLDRAA